MCRIVILERHIPPFNPEFSRLPHRLQPIHYQMIPFGHRYASHYSYEYQLASQSPHPNYEKILSLAVLPFVSFGRYRRSTRRLSLAQEIAPTSIG